MTDFHTFWTFKDEEEKQRLRGDRSIIYKDVNLTPIDIIKLAEQAENIEIHGYVYKVHFKDRALSVRVGNEKPKKNEGIENFLNRIGE